MPFSLDFFNEFEFLITEEMRQQFENICSHAPNFPGDKSKIIPLSPREQLIVNFLKSLGAAQQSNISNGPVFQLAYQETLRTEHQALIENTENLRTLLQFFISGAEQILKAITNETLSTQEQFEYLASMETISLTTSNLFKIWGDNFFTPELKNERCQMLKMTLKSLSLELSNISRALYSDLFVEHSPALLKVFDKGINLMLMELSPMLLLYLASGPAEEVDELFPLVEHIMLIFSYKATSMLAQGLDEKALLYIETANYEGTIKPFFTILDRRQFHEKDFYIKAFQEILARVNAKEKAIKQLSTEVGKRLWHATILKDMNDYFFRAPMLCDISFDSLDPEDTLKRLNAKIKTIKEVTLETLPVLQLGIQLLHRANLRHFESSQDVATICESIVGHLQKIFRDEGNTLITQAIQLHLDQYLKSLGSHKEASRMSTEAFEIKHNLTENFQRIQDTQYKLQNEVLSVLASDGNENKLQKRMARKLKKVLESKDNPFEDTKKVEPLRKEVAELSEKLKVETAKSTKIREVLARQLNMYKKLHLEHSTLKKSLENAPSTENLEATLKETQAHSQALEQQLEVHRQLNTTQQNAHKSALSEQEITHSKMISASHKREGTLRKQVEELSKQKKRLEGTSFKQTQGNLTLKKQAEDQFTYFCSENDKLRKKLASLEVEIKNFQEKSLKNDALVAQLELLQVKDMQNHNHKKAFDKQLQYWYHRYVQEKLLNQVYAYQCLQLYEYNMASGALIYNLNLQMGLNEVSIKISDAPHLEFTGDLIMALQMNPSLVIRLLLISVQHDKFFAPEHHAAICHAISQCVLTGFQQYLSLFSVITMHSAPAKSFEFLFKRGVFPHMIPLPWPEETDLLLQQWALFVGKTLEKPGNGDTFAFLIALFLPAYYDFKKKKPGSTQKALIETLSTTLVVKISHFSTDEQVAFKNRITQGLPKCIEEFEKFLSLSLATYPPAIVFNKMPTSKVLESKEPKEETVNRLKVSPD